MLPQITGRVEAPDFVISRYVPAYHPVTEAYDFGGVRAADASEGVRNYLWKCRTDGRKIYLACLGHREDGHGKIAEREIPITAGEITEVSFTVDQNARPVIAFVDNKVAKLYMYDNDSGQYQITSLGNVANPRVSLDDKRVEQVANSDIILSYIEGTTLVAKTQREKFTDRTEVQRGIGNAWFLRDIGMARDNTFRFWLYHRNAYEAEQGVAYAP